MVKFRKPINIIFTPVQAISGMITAPVFQQLDICTHFVSEQIVCDRRFPMVKPPNL
jgi:phosphomannomutase